MEFKVREFNGEEKSQQQVEADLIKKKEQEDLERQQADQSNETKSDENNGAQDEFDIDEEKVISFLKKKTGKEIQSIDSLFQAQQQGQDQSSNDDLPEDVKAFLNFKKETGRSIEDYIKINRDLEKENPDSLLREFYAQTEEGLEEEDLEYMVNRFSYDEDLDDEVEIKRKQIEKKKELNKAKKYFEELKEKYRAPLESSGSYSESDKKALSEYKELMSKLGSQNEVAEKKAKWFAEKTNEFFGDQFKGFEFKISEDQSLIYTPADKQRLLESQSNINNFLSKFVDENGFMKNAPEYHRALAIAMDPDRFARHFYEQGVAKAIDEAARRDKNISMDLRKTPEFSTKSGLQVRTVGDDKGSGLKIKVRTN